MTGALVVGDSVRGSLRDLALERLGAIDSAVLSESFFREEVARDPAFEGTEAAPVILLTASATHASSGARAREIALVGVDSRFDRLYPDGPVVAVPLSGAGRPGLPSAVLNAPLAGELGAAPGDAILLTLPRPSPAPADTPMGRRELEHASLTVRAVVAGVVPDRGAGRFGLTQAQGARPTAWLSLADLQRATARPGRVNALLLARAPRGHAEGGDPGKDPEVLARAFGPDDRGLTLEVAGGHVAVGSQEFLLRPSTAAAIEAIAARLGGRVQRVHTTVAVSLRRPSTPGLEVPYSTITAVDPVDSALPGLTLRDGAPAPRLASAEILLGEWAAGELKAAPGDEVEVDTFTLGDDGRLGLRTDTFRVAGVTRLAGLGADRSLTPTYPGIQDARHIADWDPPFPVDLTRVRPRDEAYWEAQGATPKAFVAEAAGERLWSGRHGSITSLRIVPPDGRAADAFASDLSNAIRAGIPLESSGLHLRPVREEALQGASGATDFGGLFAGLSVFLIVSGALVAGLMFRLGVERRAGEIGLLRALGFARGRVRRRFLAEGAILAAAGVLAGLPLAIAHASLMMVGLRGAWRAAVGTSMLAVHVRPASLVLGAAIACVPILIAVGTTVRRLGGAEPAALLSGGHAIPDRTGSGRVAALAAWGGLGAAVAAASWQIAAGEQASFGLSLAAGAGLLVSVLGWFSRWCRLRHRPVSGGRGAILRMAARNTSWNPGRSLLSLTLIAGACFVLAVVAAAGNGGVESGKDSGTGGFTMIATTDIPLQADPATAEGRGALGIAGEIDRALEGTTMLSLRHVPGDDVSCLNLYLPQRPRLVGMPDALIERGGFRFASTLEKSANPWELMRLRFADGAIPAIGDLNSVQWILHLGLGKDLVMRDDRGEEIRLRFVALLTGSVFQSEVLIPERALLDHFPGRSGRSFFLIETPPGKEPSVSAALESTLSREGFDAEPAAARLARYHEVERTYLSTFQLLGSLGLLLGTCGLGIVTARTLLERRGELAALRAIGFTRRLLRRMVLLEATVLVSLGAGAGTLSALVALLPRLAGGAARPAWAVLAGTVALVVLTGVAASLAGAVVVLRAPLIPALRSDR